MSFDLSTEVDAAKLAALSAIYTSGGRPRVGEVVAVMWNGGNDTRFYSFTDYNSITGFSGLSAYGISSLEVRFSKSQFIEITRTSDIADDKVDLDFWDGDESIATLYTTKYGEGTPVAIYEWFPEVDLLFQSFFGHLEAPTELDGFRFKIPAATGFRSPNLTAPHRTMYPGCQALFGGHVRQDGSYLFSTLDEVAKNDCPYNAHLGGLVGTPGFTSCPRNNLAACTARGMTKYYLAFDFTTGVTFVGGDHKWSATTRGNDSNLNKVLRVVAGRRRVSDIDVQAFQAQSGGSNPQNGYLVTLVSICEGPIVGAQDFYVNDQFVGLNHQITNQGQVGQPTIPFPTTILNYSGTAMARLDAGPKDWRGISADQIKVSATVTGSNNLRLYTAPNTYTEGYTTNRGHWIYHVLRLRRWGYGLDQSQVIDQDQVNLANWCDETLTTTDADGSTLTTTRSTFNADLNEQTVQEQSKRICSGGRFSLPFNHNGALRVIGLGQVTGPFPTFTDEGSDRNIVFENGRSTLRWWAKSDKEIINQLKVTYDNEANNWQPEKIILDDLDQQLRAGIALGDKTIRQISKDVTAFGITNYPEALRWAKLRLNLGEFDGLEAPGIKNNLRVRFKTWAPLVAALKLYPFCVIQVLNSRLQGKWFEPASGPYAAVPFVNFRVMKMRRLKDQKMEIEAQAYPGSYYTYVEADSFPGSAGEPNPGGGREIRPKRVTSLVVSRTLDSITIRTEQG